MPVRAAAMQATRLTPLKCFRMETLRFPRIMEGTLQDEAIAPRYFSLPNANKMNPVCLDSSRLANL
jgi:hypothetical protein